MGNRLALCALAGLACLPVVSSADAPPAAPPFTLNGILTQWGFTANGHFETTYTDFFSHPGLATPVATHAFDQTNSFQFNQAMLNFGYTPSDGFGVYINLLAGNDARNVNAVYGTSGDFALEQGWIQYAHGPLTIIGGRFNTLAGEEVIDSWGDTQISRSFLFNLLEPLVHTGVRGSWKFSDQFTVYLGANNTALGPFTAVDDNKSKTAEAGFSFTPTSAITVNVVDYYGLDSPSGSANNARNNYLDGVVSWQATPQILAAVNVDVVHSTDDSFGGIDTSFTGKGVAGYLTFNLTDKLAVAGRGELLTVRNPQASLVNSGQISAPVACTKCSLAEGTFTVIYSPFKNIKLSGEFRHDGSNQSSFSTEDGGTTKHSDEVEVGAQYAFGY